MFCKQCGKELGDNIKFCTQCGKDTGKEISANKLPQKREIFTKKRVLWGLGGLAVLAIVALVIFITTETNQDYAKTKDVDIASAVVNIYCEGDTEEDSSGGSGTILTEGGLVLTNAHIIPESKNDDVACVVILPDPTTGSPDEIYVAYPIVIPDLSEKYDLAFVQVHDVFYDEEEGKAYGEYPKKFPAYESDHYCKNENVKLGESVRVYGYPAISGGYALTITDGVVSSLLPDEGLIFTSAKISHGNSGGLAVDQNGCRIGIPAMVNGDENESLGIIISNDLIYEFMQEVRTYIGDDNS
jgi:putative serine protease PepD